MARVQIKCDESAGKTVERVLTRNQRAVICFTDGTVLGFVDHSTIDREEAAKAARTELLERQQYEKLKAKFEDSNAK
jgi:hypothetical protein